MNKILEHLIETNKVAMEYFQQQLLNFPKALEYLQKRKVSKEMIDLFKLGYAPEDSRYEWSLSNRVIFPFFDINGNSCGFAGRALSNEDEPKYRNSKESPIFQKGRMLYGLFQAQFEIEKLDYIILVEGQLDVISLVQKGIANVEGLGGSSFTSDQARLVCRYVDKVITVFDPDTAGQKATEKAIKLLQQMDVQVKSIKLPEGEDPDSFVLKYGKEEFLKLINND
jgi:DNA primase